MKRSAAAALLGLLAGCATPPLPPTPPSALGSNSAVTGDLGAGAGLSDASLPPHWWRLYADPRLDGYVSEALAANADLRAADANLRRASAVVAETGAAGGLQTAISGGVETSRVGNFTKPVPGTPYAYTLGLQLSLPFDLGGGIRRAVEAASADADAVEAARDRVRVAISAGVVRSYVAACSANASLAAARRVIAVQSRTLDASTRLQRAGRGTAFDVTRARGPVDQGRSTLPTLLAERRIALLELGALMGRAPAQYPEEAEGCAGPPPFARALPVGDGAALLARRPDVREADRRLAAATARIGVERSQLLPQVRLGGALGSAGPLPNLGSGETFGGSIGPLVSWSFPNRPAVRARIREAGAGAEAAAAQYDAAVTTALREVQSAMAAYGGELQRNRALDRAVADARRASAQADRLFRFGRTGFLDILTVQQQLAASEVSKASSDAALSADRVALFLALGGGWEGGD